MIAWSLVFILWALGCVMALIVAEYLRSDELSGDLIFREWLFIFLWPIPALVFALIFIFD